MSDFQSIEFWLVALIGTICVVGGFGLFARWCSFSPAVRSEQIDKLRVGMTSAEIVAVLGQPREVRQATGDKHQTWTYGAPMKRHLLVLEFSTQDRMVGFAHGVPGTKRRRNDFPNA